MRVFHDILYQSAQRFPDKAAVFLKNESSTYAQILQHSEKLCSVLKRAGIQKGDRVAFFLEKRFEKVVSIFGIAMAGGVMVPIKRLSHAHQAAYIINNCGAKVLITTYSRLTDLAAFLAEMPTLETVIAIDPSQAGKESDFGQLRLIDWQEAMANSSPEAAIGSGLIEHDLAAILYTSGSTGRPKGVVLNHLNIVAGAVSVSEYLKITENDRLLSILSFGFDYGLNQLMTAFFCGAQLVLLDHLFSKDIIQAVHKYAITGLAAVAATWNQLLQIPWSEEQIASLRYITNSGGAIPENYVRELRKRMPKVSIFLMYGLTEAFRSTYLDPHLVDEKPTSMGKAIPGAEILVLDDNDRPVKAGEAGQLVHRGPLVAQGYWGEPELTAVRFRRNPLQPPEVLIPEMVVYSGDYVRRDEEGFLYFVGRKDEMIKCAGNRVSPTEVEEVLYTTGTIQDAIVMGIPHEIYGHTIKAIVVPRPGAEIVADELIAHCRRMLPPYMIPQDIEIHQELPHNANGKLDRALVKSQVLEKLAQKKQEN